MKAKIIGISLVAVVAIAIIAAVVFVGPIEIAKTQKKSEFADWNRSGPFAVNKLQYKLGENIFIVAQDLGPNDVGSMVFVMPNQTTKYISIPFDGNEKSGFNQYFKPAASKARKICSTDDLVGRWIVVLNGTNYKPITFQVLNETLEGSGTSFSKVC